MDSQKVLKSTLLFVSLPEFNPREIEDYFVFNFEEAVSLLAICLAVVNTMENQVHFLLQRFLEVKPGTEHTWCFKLKNTYLRQMYMKTVSLLLPSL